MAMFVTDREGMVECLVERLDRLRGVAIPVLVEVVEEGIDIGALAKKTDGYTGSHLVGLVNNAELEAMHRLGCDSKDDAKVVITQADFNAALAETKETRERAGGSIMEEIRLSGESSFAELYN